MEKKNDENEENQKDKSSGFSFGDTNKTEEKDLGKVLSGFSFGETNKTEEKSLGFSFSDSSFNFKNSNLENSKKETSFNFGKSLSNDDPNIDFLKTNPATSFDFSKFNTEEKKGFNFGQEKKEPLPKGFNFETKKKEEFNSLENSSNQEEKKSPIFGQNSEKEKNTQQSNKFTYAGISPFRPEQSNSTFGTNGQTNSTFGASGQTNSGFGLNGQTNSGFKSNSFGSSGQSNSGFGSSVQTNSTFGSNGQTNSGFKSSGFGSSGQTNSSFGSNGQTNSSFGSIGQTNSGFGSGQTNSGFGSRQTNSSFGSNSFGSIGQTNSGFGGSTSGFGNTFGTFKQTNNQPSTSSGFGFETPNGFGTSGQQTISAFGSNTQQSTSSFGGSTNSFGTFQTQQSTGFGSTSFGLYTQKSEFNFDDNAHKPSFENKEEKGAFKFVPKFSKENDQTLLLGYESFGEDYERILEFFTTKEGEQIFSKEDIENRLKELLREKSKIHFQSFGNDNNNNFVIDFQKILLDTYKDALIICKDNVEIKVHKAIISVTSSYFNDEFILKKKDKLTLDYQSSIVSIIINYLYTYPISFNHLKFDDMLDLIDCSNFLQLSNFKKELENDIIKKIDIFTAYKVWKRNLYQNECLKVLNFNIYELLSSGIYLHWDKNFILNVFEKVVKGEAKYRLILQWASKNIITIQEKKEFLLYLLETDFPYHPNMIFMADFLKKNISYFSNEQISSLNEQILLKFT